MESLVGYSPTNIWVMDQADVPINDKVGSKNIVSKGTTYPTFENPTDVASIVGISNSSYNSSAGVGGVYTGGSTDFDHDGGISFFYIFHFDYTWQGSGNYLIFGSFTTSTADKVVIHQSTTNGFLGLQMRDSVVASTQSAFVSGLVTGTTYSLLVGYDAGQDVWGWSTNASPSGTWTTATTPTTLVDTVAANKATGQPIMFMGKNSSATDAFPTNRSVLSYVARFYGSGLDNWQLDRSSIITNFHNSLPTE